MTVFSASDFEMASAMSIGQVSHEVPSLTAPSGRVMVIFSRGSAARQVGVGISCLSSVAERGLFEQVGV